ncbi:MAG: TRAP transporter small permease [Syntrophomonadaceae bacterium]|nr:TRAP transporter small permease [Syntrophomonadaceae bacterium]
MTKVKVAAVSNAPPPAKAPEGLKIRTELKETAFDRVLLLVSSVIFCFVVLFVIMQVLIRYVTVHVGLSLPWTEEAARYLLIFFVFFGSAVAWRKKEHITITSLVDYFPAKVKLVLEFISCLLILFFLAVAVIGSYQFTFKMMVSPVGAIPWLRVGHLYGMMTLGLTFIGIYQIRWLIYYIDAIRQSFFGKGRVTT